MAVARIPINLASEPFQRDRPLLVASLLAAGLLAGTLILLSVTAWQQRAAAKEARDLLAETERQVEALNREAAALEAELRQPGNAAVLAMTIFLNGLLQRKAISWTKLFADLETVMPGKVRLVTVRPYIAGDQRVQVEMVVGATSPEPVIDFLKRLESSPHFGATQLLSSQPPTQNEPLYRYRVNVSYAQKL